MQKMLASRFFAVRRGGAQLAALLVAVALTSVGCSSSDAPSNQSATKTQDPQDAQTVCGRSLDSTAAHLLEEVAGSRAFTSEVPESMSSIADSMKTEPLVTTKQKRGKEHFACNIYWRGSATSRSPLEISFQWDNSASGSTEHSSDETATHYDVADEAWSTDKGSYIAFRCPIHSKNNFPQKADIVASLFILSMAPNNLHLREANLRIVYTFSVQLAENLDCLSTGNLPKELNKITTFPSKVS